MFLTLLAAALRRLPGVALLLALPALLLAAPGLARLFQLNRAAVLGGEAWRLVTCHWTHWTPGHLAWDLAAFVLLAGACELHPACGRRRLLAAVGLAALAIPAVFWIALPEMDRYRGLSGIDSALFVLLAVTLLRHELAAGNRRTAGLGAAALAALAAKIVFETATGAALFVAPQGEFVPVPLAHLIGGLAGGMVGGWGGGLAHEPSQIES